MKKYKRRPVLTAKLRLNDQHIREQEEKHKLPEESLEGLHVKIPENFFKILEEGKNVGKFIFR